MWRVDKFNSFKNETCIHLEDANSTISGLSLPTTIKQILQNHKSILKILKLYIYHDIQDQPLNSYATITVPIISKTYWFKKSKYK